MADFDPDAAVGSLALLRSEGDDQIVTTREGWVPEEILEVDLDVPAVVVLWRSFPRRQYLRPELWVAGDEPRRVWPRAGEERSLYEGRVRYDRKGSRPVLDLEFALVGENFEFPLLKKRERWAFSQHAARRVAVQVDEPAGSAQVLNRIADLHDEGDAAAARALGATLEGAGEEILARRAALEPLPTGDDPVEVRAALNDVAGQVTGPRALAAADRLLRMTLEEAGHEN